MLLNSIDFASPSTTGTDTPAGTPPETGAAPSGFGKLIGHALAQMGNKPAGAAAGADSAEQVPGPKADGEPKQDGASTDPGTAMPWMAGWQGVITVQQVSVGPNLKAITPSTPAPDDSSLAAFAKAQGLDVQAIAWLMSGRSDTPSTTAVAGTPGASGIAPTISGTQALIGTLPPTGELLSGMPSSATLTSPANALSANATVPPGLASAAAPQTAASTAMAALLVGQQASNPMGQPEVAMTIAHMAGDGSPVADADATFTAMRWAQLGSASSAPASPALPSPTTAGAAAAVTDPGMVVASATVGAASLINARTPGNWQFGPTRTAIWHESELQLGDLGADAASPDAAGPAALATALASSALDWRTDLADAALAPRENGLSTPSSVSTLAPSGTAAPAASTAAQTIDQMEQLSQKMADAIGQRLMREIDRGHWNVRLMLKPAHLGHIEVEMRLHAGALDASFTTPQAQTRDLLQDGLSRLKETLGQMGMDVANLDVRNGQNRQNGGNPTPGSARTATAEASTGEAEAPTPVTGSTPRPRSADGWDVMV